ncbi:TIGR03808 family TAT-translocated repetitive protein [Arsenicitalea aurantiaca]|uniref:TIGR03808 family TAT-translocated repetitive protein n=1 Tax=Arsenicitalea aurantiaca TaxID=1783274 RepID=UPI0013150881|nr:TIGR03808 family TAT-translocated repetitive protein [Arsenicitalea aurantiaca]
MAIFSEFGFSGSLIADNLIDGAALGISMTNLDTGGRLAICSGNLVRNIAPASAVNPDTVPVGIFAEADAVVTGNIVEDVPGTGILAGWGPYLRDVLVTDNLVRNADIGIAASVAPGAGRARIAGNLITGARRHAIAGMAWSEVAAPDLVAEAAAHPHLAIGENTID